MSLAVRNGRLDMTEPMRLTPALVDRLPPRTEERGPDRHAVACGRRRAAAWFYPAAKASIFLASLTSSSVRPSASWVLSVTSTVL